MSEEYRDELISQILKSVSTKCRHYNGCANEKCKAGVVYKEVQEDASPGKPLRLPCFTIGMFAGPELPCESRSIPDAEESLAIATSECDKAYRHAAAVSKAKEDARAKGYKKGSGGRGEARVRRLAVFFCVGARRTRTSRHRNDCVRFAES